MSEITGREPRLGGSEPEISGDEPMLGGDRKIPMVIGLDIGKGPDYSVIARLDAQMTRILTAYFGIPLRVFRPTPDEPSPYVRIDP